MARLTLVTLVHLVMVTTSTKGQSNETELKCQSKIWCTRSVGSIKSEYRKCKPQPCIYSNDDHDDYYYCPPGHPLDTTLSPSCQWLKLRKDQHFQLDFANGSIYELKTNMTNQLGTYVNNPDSTEAIICREQRLPDDNTEDINIWCSHSIHMDPKMQKNVSLNIPHLNLTLCKGLYHVSNDNRTDIYVLDFGLKTDFYLTNCGSSNSTQPFQLQSRSTLLFELDKVHEVFPGGHYDTLIVCRDTVPPTVGSDYIYILCLVSAIFLFLTLLVQVFLLKLNYHTIALMCHVISTMVMFICIAVCRIQAYVASDAGKLSSISVYYVTFFYIESEVGRFLYFLINYVSTMSTYLWLNVIAYEIWKAFSYMRVPTGLLGYDVDEKRSFVMKSLYAWGISLALCFVIIGLSHDHRAAEYFGLTLVSEKTTFFYTYRSLLIFLYVPMAILLVVNLVFFGLTIWNIRTTTRNTAIVNDKNSKKLLHLCWKLLVVMGVIWMADVITFMMGDHINKDVVNGTFVIYCLQGVAIFVVYVCKRSTWRMIKRRCCGQRVGTNFPTRSQSACTDIEMME